MNEFFIGASLAVGHTLAIMGYLSILLWIGYQFADSNKWMASIARLALFLFGIGPLFLAPAYEYGRYKALITSQALVTFGVVELTGIAGVLYLIKSLDTILSEKRGNSARHQKRPFDFEIKDFMSDSPDKKAGRFIGAGICFGVAIGCGIGVAIGNLSLGIGPGIAIGVAIGAIMSKSRR